MKDYKYKNKSKSKKNKFITAMTYFITVIFILGMFAGFIFSFIKWGISHVFKISWNKRL